jgi:hypothetical protein
MCAMVVAEEVALGLFVYLAVVVTARVPYHMILAKVVVSRSLITRTSIAKAK